MFAVVIIQPEVGFVPKHADQNPISGTVIKVFASEEEIMGFLGECEFTPKLFKKPELSLGVATDVAAGWNEEEIVNPQNRWAIVSNRVPMVGVEFQIVPNELIEQVKELEKNNAQVQ